MNGQFTSPINLPADPDAPIGISGPLSDVESDRARVLFLIVQGDGPNAVTVCGEGVWTGGPSWFGRVNRKGKRAAGGEDDLGPGPARGIALAIAIKDATLDNGQFIPPTIAALTWCVNIEFT
jgi:hypothetical protein